MLTPEQQANETKAQAIRFGTSPASPTAGTNTSGFDSLKDLSIANSPVDTPSLNNRGGIDKNNNPSTGIKRTVRNESNVPTFDSALKAEERSAQAQINSINQYAAEKLQSLQPRQEERLAETSSVNSLTGLAGSSEANRTTEKTSAVNQKENDLVRAEAEMQAQAVLGNVSAKAIERAKAQREAFSFEQDQDQAQRSAEIQESVDNATILAQSGVDLEAYKTKEPESYQYLADNVGGEDILSAMFTLNRPKESILDKKIEGGKYIISYQNPITGAVRIETVDLGLPVGYSKTIDAGNRILAIPDNWSGDPSDLITINKGLTPGQAAGGGSGSSGPSNQDIDNERAFFGQFRGEPIVKNYNEVVNKKLSVNSIINNGSSGPRDLALVFEFMKALDPTSVVRESEYETAAKSGNIFAGIYAKFNGYLKEEGGMLPENVKQEFNAITDEKLSVSQRQYDNLKNQYVGIAERQGLNPQNVVVDYENALDEVAVTGNDLAGRVSAAGYDYEALSAKYTDEEIEEAISQQQ